MHTLTDGTTSVQLNSGMVWRDEFSWVDQVSRAQRALDGTLLIEASARVTGRPITLSGGQDHGWITRGALLQLRALLGDPGQAMTLTLDDGRVFAVMATTEDSPLEAEMVMEYGRPTSGDWYFATLKLITI